MKWSTLLLIALVVGGAVLYYNFRMQEALAPSTTGTLPVSGDAVPESTDPGSRTLITLDLSNQGFSEAHTEFFSHTEIQKLDLSHNNMTGALPAEVRHLQELIILDLSDNQFTGVPAEVGQLSKLEVLDLSNNPITGLPHEIGNLKNLRVLDLRGTNYAEYDLNIIRAGLPDTVDIKVD